MHQFAQELGRVVGVDYVRRAALEVESIEQARYEGGGLSVGEWDDDHSLGKTVDQGQGFGLAGDGTTLALKVH